ncbi:HCLS1-binding protein 3 [Danio rerio]|uniref:HCLS1-binding protein 3 n=2 Tax=Danio rerio TaxID=7955 RepID=F6PCK0_DANRE|nr:HCLS1-binding protein 3 [Danio rerio]|eukprot:NP_001243150.1 HCLS1-binding protein 3 [Danio rerio]
MSDGRITSRPLQNEATGIDLHVPLYQEIRGSVITGHVEYQIVVVTCLSSFKSAIHKTGDVLQFVVSKKYSEIEQLYYSLKTKYPSIHLPPMPRKALFVSETDLCNRRVAFDELVKFLSKHPLLANCPELLEFLGAKTTAVEVKTINKPDFIEKEVDDGLDFFESGDPLQKPSEDVELLDPLGSEWLKKDVKPKDVCPVGKCVPKPKSETLFEEEDDTELFSPAKKGHVMLFDNTPLRSIDSSPFSNTSNGIKMTESKVDEDIEELLSVEMDLHKHLSVSKTVRCRPDTAMNPMKPKVKSKPVASERTSNLTQATDLQLSGTEVMNQMDILQYIQQNDLPASEDLDLFKS